MIHEVKVLAVFAYESSRKRMSVIVQLPPELVGGVVGGKEEVRLFTKGADSVVLELLAPGSKGADEASLERLNETLGEWAEMALRTLVFASREIDRVIREGHPVREIELRPSRLQQSCEGKGGCHERRGVWVITAKRRHIELKRMMSCVSTLNKSIRSDFPTHVG